MPIDYLKLKNTHERDNHITFDEGPHIYTINGDSGYTSVTTWNHKNFEKFDADKIINRMMKSPKWKDSPYYNMTKEQIKKQWSDSGKEASSKGTALHYDIEKFYNNMEVANDSEEYEYFMNFVEDKKNLVPYRTEWMIYDKELKLAGSIDMLFINPDDGSVEIYDWKRSKEIKFDNKWKRSHTKCISHIPDCNYYHYCLQLNTYKYILEKNYGLNVSKMYLVCLHPNNHNKNYIRYKVKKLDKEIKALVKRV